MAPVFFLLLLSLISTFYTRAQNISTNTPVPPLQWINLSNLLVGTSRPPPLRDAAIGYDETSRSLIVFGGLSESGFPQSQTYILNLNTLTWTTPSPPINLQRSPPSRSAVVVGSDFAASNRHGFVIIGGRGSGGEPLSDIWEYDFNNQFWSEISTSSGGPPARWGASGGIDIRVPFIQDPVVPGPNNTFYLAGGFDGTNIYSFSDVWRLNISGTLSSNLPDDVKGSWDHLKIGNLPDRVDQAGTIIGQQIIITGGCNSTASLTSTETSCAQQDSYVVDVQRRLTISPGACPAPRVGPVLVPNQNGFSSSFSSQVFLLLGTFNSSVWQDDNGLAQGEVAILNINTGTWTRIIPSGDPGASGDAQFPSPREGASVLSFSSGLVGSSRSSSSDTIVFGGQDSSGKFLSEVWLLRAYSGVITPTNPTWTGFGNGQLQTGVNADGSGVHVSYIKQCASLVSGPSSNPPPGPPARNPVLVNEFDTSFLHKLLAPLSLVIIFPVLLFFQTTSRKGWMPNQHSLLQSIFTIFALAAYGIGIGGFVLSFTTMTAETATRNLHLKTAHGLAGLVFFVGLYFLLPLLYLAFVCFRHRPAVSEDNQSQTSELGRQTSIGTNEKLESVGAQSALNVSPPASPRPRTQSWGASDILRPSTDGGLSSESTPPETPHRGFEVLNRPNRVRKTSGTWPSPEVSGTRNPLPTTRSLGEIDWLLRRRTLHAVGELDYTITQAHNARFASSKLDNHDAQPIQCKALIKTSTWRIMVLHILTQSLIMGLSATTLSVLWFRSPRFLFAIFLAWVVAYYIAVIALAWYHYPATSLATMFLSAISDRNRLQTPPPDLLLGSTPLTPSNGPYNHHRPPHRLSTHLDELSYPHASPLNVDIEDDDDDIDEDTRQRAIEEEMERRDVSIVTVPRRKLWIANPS
ncbi:hypothetical protein B0H34DRAFT_688877 [Crassisporium funariophilum]|nr:hypothetical protein B0H34DRAFT_688877 [Crassisporium funariophilum]